MKKIKKFDDGGPTGGRPIGGRYVDSGDGQIFVPDTSAPVADTPVAATMGQVPVGMGQDDPRVASQLAGLAGLSGVAGGTGMLSGMDRPDVTARPMGLMVPRGRGMGAGMANQLAASSMMKKGGTVKKMAKGGKTATVRGHGCEQRGKTKGRFV
jgi:hypothetical protein